MHLPSQCVCIHTQGCVCARDTEQSKERMHNHTLVQDFPTTLEISLHAYLVFQCRQYLSSRLTWLPILFLINFISSPCQGRSSMIHALFCGYLQCTRIQKNPNILMLWQSNKTVYHSQLWFCRGDCFIATRFFLFFSFFGSKWRIKIWVIKSQCISNTHYLLFPSPSLARVSGV